MCKYRYRISTEIPIHKGSNAIYKNFRDIDTESMPYFDINYEESKQPGWTTWSTETFESVEDCEKHCSQYFPFRKFIDSRTFEIGCTKFLHINAKKNDNIERILLHIEEV